MVVVAAAAAATAGEACIWMLWSTHLQHLRTSVWGSARVLGVSPKGSVGDAAQGVAEDVAEDVAQDLAFGARAARALLATPPPPPPPPPLCSSR